MHPSVERLNLVKNKIEEIINRKQLKTDPQIIAVTKSFPPNIWEFAVKHNLTTLAENKIQETKEKLKNFQQKEKINLHFIGTKRKKSCREEILY